MGKRYLLIGNGINSALGAKSFGPKEIYYRFRDVISRSLALYTAAFSESAAAQVLQCLDTYAEEQSVPNIERICSGVYKVLEKAVHPEQACSENWRRRTNSMLSMSALTAIFFQGKDFLSQNVSNEKRTRVLEYNGVFTLNYHEFWNPPANYCTFLHGQLPAEISLHHDLEKPVLLYDRSRYENRSLRVGSGSAKRLFYEVTDQLGMDNTMIPVDESSILFSPDMLDKQHLKQSYPSENLFPSEDLYPSDFESAYLPLESVQKETLEVFGVSPSGDIPLLDVLSRRDQLIVYLHHPDAQKKAAWTERLPRISISFRDSEQFWK